MNVSSGMSTRWADTPGAPKYACARTVNPRPAISAASSLSLLRAADSTPPAAARHRPAGTAPRRSRGHDHLADDAVGQAEPLDRPVGEHLPATSTRIAAATAAGPRRPPSHRSSDRVPPAVTTRRPSGRPRRSHRPAAHRGSGPRSHRERPRSAPATRRRPQPSRIDARTVTRSPGGSRRSGCGAARPAAPDPAIVSAAGGASVKRSMRGCSGWGFGLRHRTWRTCHPPTGTTDLLLPARERLDRLVAPQRPSRTPVADVADPLAEREALGVAKSSGRPSNPPSRPMCRSAKNAGLDERVERHPAAVQAGASARRRSNTPTPLRACERTLDARSRRRAPIT